MFESLANIEDVVCFVQDVTVGEDSEEAQRPVASPMIAFLASPASCTGKAGLHCVYFCCVVGILSTRLRPGGARYIVRIKTWGRYILANNLHVYEAGPGALGDLGCNRWVALRGRGDGVPELVCGWLARSAWVCSVADGLTASRCGFQRRHWFSYVVLPVQGASDILCGKPTVHFRDL
jgi:hypothetical protein